MAGLRPGHPRLSCLLSEARTWIPGTRPGMTNSVSGPDFIGCFLSQTLRMTAEYAARSRLALSGDDLIDLRQQLPPRLVDFRRPVGSENFAQRLGDHAEKFAEQLSRRAVGVVRLHLALDHAKVPGAVAGEIQDGVDGQRQH